jgi:hypothetical protein
MLGSIISGQKHAWPQYDNRTRKLPNLSHLGNCIIAAKQAHWNIRSQPGATNSAVRFPPLKLAGAHCLLT